MIHFFSNHKIIFKLINIIFIIFYLYPGSLIGKILYNDFTKQPKITSDFFYMSSNHIYMFIILSIFAGLTYYKSNKLNYLFIFLIIYSIALELFHIIIPIRAFQMEDLLGNFFGICVVFFIIKLVKYYDKTQ